MHSVRTDITPIAIGALGTVHKRLDGYLRRLGVPDVIGAIRHTTHPEERTVHLSSWSGAEHSLISGMRLFNLAS